MSEQIDQPLVKFKQGDKVWISSKYFRTLYNKKIQPKQEGPFTVTKVLGPVTYQLDLPKTWSVHKNFYAGLFKPFVQTEQYGKVKLPPPPTVMDQEDWYEVDHIVRHRRKGQRTEYLVRWKDYGPHEDTWEPEGNLKNSKETLNEYKRIHKLV